MGRIRNALTAAVVEFSAVNDQPTLSTSGRVVVTFYIGTRKAATGYITVSDQACNS